LTDSLLDDGFGRTDEAFETTTRADPDWDGHMAIDVSFVCQLTKVEFPISYEQFPLAKKTPIVVLARHAGDCASCVKPPSMTEFTLDKNFRLH
jgi:hypothetical protein